MDDIAFAIDFVRINDPAPAERRDCTAIAPPPPRSAKLVSDNFPVFHPGDASEAPRVFIRLARLGLTCAAKALG